MDHPNPQDPFGYLKPDPLIDEANRLEKERQGRRQQGGGGGGGGILQLISGISSAVGQVMAFSPLLQMAGVSLGPGVVSVLYFYIAAPLGLGVAYLWYLGAIYISKGGFFNLGLGWGTIDAVLFLTAAYSAAKPVARMVKVFRGMNWMSKIVALFFFYSIAIWWNHDWSTDAHAGGAYVFCIVVSVLIERNIAFFEQKATVLASWLLS
jgi:hypothetical protein